jgi:tRNA dimethylallyltransferase
MKKILVILGSTSTGKTDLGLEFAKKLNGELISADSRQVYKYLDIGTGKMPGEDVKVNKGDGYWEMDKIKVWLYDAVDPLTQFNLYQYIQKADEAIKQISKTSKLPILVGGTGLYIRALLEGVSDFGIEKKHDLRKELEALSLEEIKERIHILNPEILKTLNNSESKNPVRLIRIYEKLISGSKTENAFLGIEKNFKVLKIGLMTDRKILRERIKRRVLSRIDQGMIEESKSLLSRDILSYQRMEELGLEYKYIARYLKGEIKTLDELINILSLKIGQFAKRQETWFKKEKNVIWFDIMDQNFISKVEKQVVDWYNEL